MTACKSCGREPENGTPTHWLGCEKAVLVMGPQSITSGGLDPIHRCEHDGCSEPKKEWSGRGARPKFCAAGHKKEK